MTMKKPERSRKDRAKDRDGVYKRRGHWHFDYKDPCAGKWRSKTAETDCYDDAKKFKREFIENLGKGKYNPSNDRTRFVDAADPTFATEWYPLQRVLCDWKENDSVP